MTTFQKALALLTPREKRRALVVLILVIGLAMLETAGDRFSHAVSGRAWQPRYDSDQYDSERALSVVCHIGY
jgi:hypothetical protein